MDDTKTPSSSPPTKPPLPRRRRPPRPAAAADTKKGKARKPVKARVLTDCAHGKANDVVLVEADVLKADNAESGLHQLDADPAAVAYAESLTKPAAAK
jgi:hypothetical protein